MKTAGTPETLKDALHSSGLYTQATDLGLDALFAKISADAAKEGAQISKDKILAGIVSEEELREKLRTVFPPEWIEKEAERIIDDAYAYLYGERETIEYFPRIEERESEARAAIAEIFKVKLAALPLCANARSYKQGFDLFRAKCRPRDLSIETASREIDLAARKIGALGKSKEQFAPGDIDPAGKLVPVRRAVEALPIIWSALAALGALLLSLALLLVPGIARTRALAAVFIVLTLPLFASAASLFAGWPHEYGFERLPEDSASTLASFRPFLEPFAAAIERSAGASFALLAALILLGGGAVFLLRRREGFRKFMPHALGAVILIALIIAGTSVMRLRAEGLFNGEGFFGGDNRRDAGFPACRQAGRPPRE